MNPRDETLEDLFAATATVERDPAFVGRVVREAGLGRPVRLRPGVVMIELLKALALVAAAAVGGLMIQLLSDALGGVVTQPAVGNLIGAALAAAVLLWVFGRRRPAVRI